MTDFIHVMAAAVERYETKSLVKYPTWEKLSNKEQVEAVFDELEEWARPLNPVMFTRTRRDQRGD